MKIYLLIFLFISTNLWASSFFSNPYLKRSPRGLLLGDAYTARADDDHTLFYNPASLGAHSGLSFNPIGVGVGLTNALDDMDRFKDMPENPAGISKRIMDYPLYANLSAVPGFKFGRFAFSAIINVETNAYLSNGIHPLLDVDYRYDRGFITGYGFNLNKTQNSRTSLGLAAKYLKRQGIQEQFSLTGYDALNAFGPDSELDKVLKQLGYGTDSAWGFDVGFEQEWKMPGSVFRFGLAAQDIYTKFNSEGEAAIPEQPMVVRTGMSYEVGLEYLKLILSYDLHPMNLGYSFDRMSHLGAEIKVAMLSILVGHSFGGFSYGGEVDLGFIRVFGGFYNENLGTDDVEIKSKRALLYVSLFDFKFDS